MHIEEAHAYCQRVAFGHYENFPVGSLLIPKKYRQSIYAVYAFARIADDFADEIEDKNLSRQKLAEWREYLNMAETGNPPDNPVFIAIGDILKRFPISPTYLHDLIDAFVQDSFNPSYKNWDELLQYCSKSANPIGRILLQIFEKYDSENILLSDSICTGLQLINFWQDLSVDIPRGRHYIPNELWHKYSISLRSSPVDSYTGKKQIISELTNFTKNIYEKGIKLASVLPGRFGMEIGVTYFGGARILDKVKNLGGEVFSTRPVLNRKDWLEVIWKAIIK